MSTTKTTSHSHDLLKDDWTAADYQAAEKWEFWYLGLRAHLHEIVNEEHGGANALADFFDYYGLSMEVAGGNISLYAFLDAAPPIPSKNYPQFPAYALMERIDAAARMKPMNFPIEDLPQVASALRQKAAAFVRLAEQIEAGEFAFPKS